MGNKIFAIYDDEERLIRAVKKIRKGGIAIHEVYTPFPVHGLREALGLPRTRMAIVSFLCSSTGVFLALWGIWYMMIYDWPMNIGGKPSFSFLENLPSFVPPLFEAMVFSAAHGMVLIFLLRSWILPGVTPKNPDPRTTADKFLVEIIEDGEGTREGIISALRETGAEEVRF
ncbi:MAG: DUF3341 domain-containing protein [Bacteroidetes bacterium]|nr:DUF3341 domain-containing protein [Bacteroidota bacterium]